MLETIKYATISNIYVKDLRFYDENKETELKEMCQDYGITYLPSKDRKSCYQLIENTFIKKELTTDITCNPYDRIFDKSTLSKFENGNHDEVMFVVEDDKIKGVVHIVDYNSDFINFEFYKATAYLERMLRKLLLAQNETNGTLLSWMLEKSKKSFFWKNRYANCVPEDDKRKEKLEQQRKDCNPFQTFFLNDLLMFAGSKRYVSAEFRRNCDAITNIRNWVAHNKDLTHKSKTDNHPLYKIKGLKEFVNNANLFFKCYEELEELVFTQR